MHSAAAISNIAILEMAEGRYTEAKDLLHKALQIRQRSHLTKTHKDSFREMSMEVVMHLHVQGIHLLAECIQYRYLLHEHRHIFSLSLFVSLSRMTIPWSCSTASLPAPR